ncbi:phage portal protein [Escherichia coli]|nr:phage portal protein [Escherichia coli]
MVMNQNDIEAMIQRYTEAEMAVLDGKSVTFNGQQMTMENLSEIRQGRQEWERRLAALITRRRGASRVPAGEVLMAILDDVIGVFSPGWKAARLRSRAVIQAYEAVKTTRTHKARRENRTADQLSQYGAVSLREQARYLDNNHDLVIGVFDKLEERVVGKNGIIVEPHPVLRNGAIARDLAAEIRTRWSEWSVSPEVTGQFTRPMLERLMLRTGCAMVRCLPRWFPGA